MQILVHAPATPPPPPTSNTTTTIGAIRRKNEPIAPLPPQAQPPCALFEREGHSTSRYPTLPELCHLIQFPKATPLLVTPPSTSTATMKSSTTDNKGLRTKFSYAICSEYGHYTHHFLTLPQLCQTFVTVHQTSLLEPS
jgi:hypothetical protein